MQPNQPNTPDPNSFFQPSSSAGPTPPPTPTVSQAFGPAPSPAPADPLTAAPANPTLPSPIPTLPPQPAAPSVPSWFASPDPNQAAMPPQPSGFGAPNFPQPSFPQAPGPMPPLPGSAPKKGQQLAIGLLVLIFLVAAAVGGTILLGKHGSKGDANHGSAGTNNPLPPADNAANKTLSNITVDPTATAGYKLDSKVSADDAADGVEGSLFYDKLNSDFTGTDVSYSWVDNAKAAQAAKDTGQQDLTAQQKAALEKLAKDTGTKSSAAPDIQFKDAAGTSYPLKCTMSTSNFDKIYSVHYTCLAEFNHKQQGLAFLVSSEASSAATAASDAATALQTFTSATTLVF